MISSNPNVWIKQGVLGDMSNPMRKGLGRVAKHYAALGLDTYITSIREGNHSPGSLHYDGNAVDIKRQGQPVAIIRQVLGQDFDVVEYSKSNGDIFHCEFDPKGK